MDDDKETTPEKKNSAAELSAGFYSRIRHKIRRLRRHIARYLAGEEFRGYVEKVRRYRRRAVRFLRTQYEDARRAYEDGRRKILNEARPVEKREERLPHLRDAVPAREGKPLAFAPRAPAVAPESPVPKMRRVLVVGGMDFLGRALVRRLNARGMHDVVIADWLENECWRNLPALKFDEFFSLAELSHRLGSRTRPLGGFSHIFYLGGWTTGDSPLALPKSLLALAAQDDARMIAVSSACSLGPRPGRDEVRRGAAENFRPETYSGVMACLFDRYALPRLPARNYLSLKHHRLFGPHERVDGSIYGLVKVAYEQICATGNVTLPQALHPDEPEGKRRHDFLPVQTAARMAVFLAANDDADGIYELGSGTAHSAHDVVKMVFRALKKKPSVQWQQESFSAPSSQPEAADLSRLIEAGWSGEEPALEESVADYVKQGLAGADLDWEEKTKVDSAGQPDAAGMAPTRIFPARRKTFPVKAWV